MVSLYITIGRHALFYRFAINDIGTNNSYYNIQNETENVKPLKACLLVSVALPLLLQESNIAKIVLLSVFPSQSDLSYIAKI